MKLKTTEKDRLMSLLSSYDNTKLEGFAGYEDIEIIREILTIQEEVYYRWFGVRKDYNLKHIAHQIYIPMSPKKKDKESLRYHLVASIYTANYLLEILENRRIKPRWENNQLKLSKECIKSTFLDSLLLLQEQSRYLRFSDTSLLHYKSIVFNARSSIECADSLFYANNLLEKTSGSIKFRYISVFFIRQTIEMRIRGTFGIKSCFYKDDDSIAIINFSDIFNLLEIGCKSNAVIFPVDLSILRKIYKWSNTFIHASIPAWSWEIAISIELLRPLFESGSHGNHYSPHGGVKIKREFYIGVEDYLSDIVGKPLRLERLTIPEALIID